jgi:membrane protein
MTYKIHKKNITLLIISIFLSFLGFSLINKIVLYLLPKERIVISSYDKSDKGSNNYITLLEKEESYKFYDLKTSFLENKNKEGIIYNGVGENGYSMDAVHLNSSINEFTLEVKKAPNTKITFYKIGTSDKILIKSKKNSQVLDISHYKAGDIIDYFPFKESKILIIYNSIFYLLFSIIIFSILKSICLVIEKIKEKKYKLNSFFYDYSPQKMVLLIYGLIVVYVSIRFFTNKLPKVYLLENADENYYWKLGEYLKNQDFKNLYKNTYVVRGYVTYILPTFSQIIGDVFHIQKLSRWIYYLINNMFISLLLGYIVPELYKKLNNKEVKNYQILLLFIIFTIFWKGAYYTVLSDFLGVIFLFWAILNFLNYISCYKKRYAVFTGILLAIASLYRQNYKLGVYLVILLCFIDMGYRYLKNKSFLKMKKSFLLYFILGIVLVCLPQIKINYEKGHIGLFTFDRKGSWSYEIGNDVMKSNETLADELMNDSLTYAFIGWPYPKPDVTALKIKKNFSSDINTRISFMQGISAYTVNPIDSMVIIGKKIFLGLNIKTSEIYPKSPYKSNSDSYIFSLLNYFIIATFFYFIGNKKIRKSIFSKKEIILGSILILLYILPQLLLHVEWRYYIILYLISYYTFSFKIEEYLKNKENNKISYFKFITLSIFILFLLNSFYYDVI